MEAWRWTLPMNIVFETILAIAYIIVLLRVLTGSKLKNVALMTALLLLSDILYITGAVYTYKANAAEEAGDFAKVREYADLVNLIDTTGDFFFIEAHWILATHYYRTAVNTPKIIRKEEVPLSACNRVVFWTGIVVFAIFTIGEGYFLDFHESKTAKLLALTALILSQLSFILIGIVCIWSVLLINSFMATIPQ